VLTAAPERGGPRMTPLAVLLLAAGTCAFRGCGPVLHRRRGAVLAGAAGAVGVRDRAAVRAGRDLGTHRRSRLRRRSRPAGVLAGGVLAARRAPFLVAVAAAVATTAMLRLLGLS